MKKIVLSFVLPFILFGCGGNQISEDRPTTGNIVFLGASITAGFGLSDGEGYVDRITEKLVTAGYPYTTINQGISGNRTDQGLARIDEVLEAEPEIVVLALGGNDFLQGKPLTEVQGNLESIVSVIQSEDVDVLLVGVTAPPTRGLGYTLESRKMFESVAENFGLVLMPNYLKGIVLNQKYMLDQVHPNSAGHQILADNMWEYLEPLLRQ